MSNLVEEIRRLIAEINAMKLEEKKYKSVQDKLQKKIDTLQTALIKSETTRDKMLTHAEHEKILKDIEKVMEARESEYQKKENDLEKTKKQLNALKETHANLSEDFSNIQKEFYEMQQRLSQVQEPHATSSVQSVTPDSCRTSAVQSSSNSNGSVELKSSSSCSHIVNGSSEMAWLTDQGKLAHCALRNMLEQIGEQQSQLNDLENQKAQNENKSSSYCGCERELTAIAYQQLSLRYQTLMEEFNELRRNYLEVSNVAGAKTRVIEELLKKLLSPVLES